MRFILSFVKLRHAPFQINGLILFAHNLSSMFGKDERAGKRFRFQFSVAEGHRVRIMNPRNALETTLSSVEYPIFKRAPEQS